VTTDTPSTTAMTNYGRNIQEWMASFAQRAISFKDTVKEKYITKSDIDTSSLVVTAFLVATVFLFKSLGVMMLYNFAAPRLLIGRSALSKEIGWAVALALVLLFEFL
jgi:hypothetical protein